MFRWRCKDNNCVNNLFLGSGLDDYPRLEKYQGQISKGHLDLHNWAIFFADSLAQISKYVNESAKEKYYLDFKEYLINNLNEFYLDK